MKLEIYVGKSNINGPVATCDRATLLDTLRDVEVVDAISQSITVVRVIDAAGNELAKEWYDAATAHEEGSDWAAISERLAAAVQ